MRELFVYSTFSTAALEEGLAWWIRQLWPDCRLRIGGYDTLFQCVFDPDAHGLSNAEGTVLLALDPGALVRLQGDTLTMDGFCQALEQLAQRPRLRVVLALLHGDADAPTTEMARVLDAVPGVITVDAGNIERFLTGPIHTSPAMARTAGVPFTRHYLAALATTVAWRLDGLERPPGKVLVLDCDHTLWNGVVAEDGIEGLRVEARHRRLTKIARRLHADGWLICLCSRNEHDDVRAAFEALGRDRDLGLAWEDLTATRINWDAKADNLQSLAVELDLGLDSFVFIDDDPVECARVRGALPEVSVMHLDPAEDNGWLEHVWRFEQQEQTREDAMRARFYEENREREALSREHRSAGDLLSALAIELSVEPASGEDALRIAQLSLRTNQFNFSGRKLQEAELSALIASEDAVVLRACLSDRFGDYGLVGAAVARDLGDRLVVEGFWLSCRALGRGVEHAMVHRLGAAAEARGCPILFFELVKLPRNVPGRRFAKALGPVDPDSGSVVVETDAARALRFDPDQPTDFPAEAPAVPERATAALPLRSRDDALIARCVMDSALLRAMEETVAPRPELHRAYVAPRTDLERALAGIWAQTLALETVGINDEFEELGGRSIQLVTIHARIFERLGRELEFTDLFRFTSVSALARFLEGRPSDRNMDGVASRSERQRRARGGFRRIDRSGFRA